MNWDIPILIGSLLAILLSFVWSRATFIGPVLLAWAGAAVGGTVAFVLHFDKANDRVGIEHIVPSAVFGALCGLLPGFAVRAAYLRGSGRCKVVLEALAVASLFAGVGMIVGWHNRRFDDDVLVGTLRLGAAGAGIGTVLVLLDRFFFLPLVDSECGSDGELLTVEQLLSRAARLDRTGSWDEAVATYEAVLKEPGHGAHHEYARNSIRDIERKKSLAQDPAES